MLQFAETFASICGRLPENTSPAERCAKVFTEQTVKEVPFPMPSSLSVRLPNDLAVSIMFVMWEKHVDHRPSGTRALLKITGKWYDCRKISCNRLACPRRKLSAMEVLGLLRTFTALRLHFLSYDRITYIIVVAVIGEVLHWYCMSCDHRIRPTLRKCRLRPETILPSQDMPCDSGTYLTFGSRRLDHL